MRKYQLPDGLDNTDYSQEYVVVRLKAQAGNESKTGRSTPSPLASYQFEHFLSYLDEGSNKSTARPAGHPLGNIYKIRLQEGQKPIEVINTLLGNKDVLYAEPYFNYRPLYIPDDPEAQPGANQWYLTNIRAYDAWSIHKGDTSVVIGILDSGILPDHFDLQENLYINYDDPINGQDDDNDGLVDNYKGWDIANNDNNPIADTDPHGIGVTGISNGAANNGLGIAGVGFKSKFMPIKIFSSGSNFFYKGYEAIALAADLGCQVINLSWGSANSYSQAGQDIINYAVEQKDVVIVAAAGNTNADLDFYPASFDNVLSVGASNINDEKAGFSTYSTKIDLMAPGKDIFVIASDSTYKIDHGTSYASPMVAGTAALVRSRFPFLTAKQVMERVRINTDDIYNIGGNATYTGKLGSGRLNMFKALTDNINPSLRIESIAYNNGIGKYAFYDDTLSISIDITNYLTATSNAMATLSSTSPYVSIVQDKFNIGRLPTMASAGNAALPFRVKLSSNLPADTELTFRVDFTDGVYKDFQYFTLKSSPEYVTVDNGTLALTANSSGELGYNLDTFREGIGYTYNGHNLLDNIGLVIAAQPDQVKDSAPNLFNQNFRDHDFEAIGQIKLFQNSEAPLDARSTYTDRDALPNPLNIRVGQKILAWDGPTESDFLVVEYRLTNLSGAALNQLHTGLMADWNLNDKSLNEANWDDTNLLGYVKDVPSDTLYTGIALLNTEAPFYFAIDNKNANGNTADIPTALNDIDKYNLVANGLAKTTAGTFGGGNDVSQAIGYTVSTLGPNASKKLAFALVSGRSLTSLQDAAMNALTHYQSYLSTPPLLYETEACPGDVTQIDPPQGNIYEFYADVTLNNLLYIGDNFMTPPVNAAQTYYIVNKDHAYDGEVFRVMAKPKPPQADFSISSNPLFLDETGETSVQLSDLSIDGASWSWDFGNGYTSTVQNPIMNYQTPGDYNINLTVTNDLGCVEVKGKTLKVANRSNKPDIANQQICKGEPVTLSATNATNLKVYDDVALDHVIFSGATFNSGPIDKDSVFYVTSVDSAYESNPKAVNITTSKVKAKFDYQVDTNDLSKKHLLHFYNKSENETLYAWVINDQLEGNSTDITYDYSNMTAIDVKLLAEGLDGCQDSTLTTISPKISPPPGVDDMFACPGDSVVITPSNGSVFLFYTDANLNKLIKKGATLIFDNLLSDTTVYITSIDSLLESDAIEVTLDVSEIQADFTITPDSLDIGDLDQLVITNNSTEADSYKWFLQDSLVSDQTLPELKFNNTGNYEINLIASNITGCISGLSHTLTLTNITGSSSHDFSYLMYPNPVSTQLMFKSPTPVSLSLFDIKGMPLVHFEQARKVSVDMSGYPDGVYLVQVIENQKTTYKKVVKSSN